MRIGYGRTSTRDQNPGAQHDALTAVGCEQIFTDKARQARPPRPRLDKALLVACRRSDQLCRGGRRSRCWARGPRPGSPRGRLVPAVAGLAGCGDEPSQITGG